MKRCIPLFCLAGMSCGVFGAAFQNLGFDNANTNNIRDEDGVPPIQLVGTTSEMIPGWQLSLGTNAETMNGLDAIRPGPGYASIFTSGNSLGRPVVGRYSLSLNGDVDTSGPRSVPVRSSIAGGKAQECSGPPRPSDVLRAGTARTCLAWGQRCVGVQALACSGAHELIGHAKA